METLRRGGLAEYAYDFTKRMLFDGRLSPGSKLRVEDVVSALHTSRQPVMDAFKRLAAEGYLEITPQVGCRVVVPSDDEIADFFLILGAVAGLAADCAADRRTALELEQLDALAQQIESLCEQEPRATIAPEHRRLDLEFHRHIRSMAHSDAVAQLAAGLLDRREFYVLCRPTDEVRYVEHMQLAHHEHRSIRDAIAARNGEQARARTEALVLTFGRLTVGSTLPAGSATPS